MSEIQNEQQLQQEGKQRLPKALASLILGISSIVFGCYFGVILGIIGLVLGGKAKGIYLANPDMYTGYKMAKIGRILSIIGIIIGAIWLVVCIISVIAGGSLLGGEYLEDILDLCDL